MIKKIKFKLSLINNSILDSTKLDNKTVLFFYPKAMTGGCSIEVQDFQKKLSTFKKLGFDVFGAAVAVLSFLPESNYFLTTIPRANLGYPSVFVSLLT